MPIDSYKALARNALKKTGDTMIAGDLTLFQAPTNDMHAATKKYVDDAICALRNELIGLGIAVTPC